MMAEGNPLFRAKKYLTFRRSALDSSPPGEEADVPGYARVVGSENFQQEQRSGVDGGGVYFTKSNSNFEGWGTIILGYEPAYEERFEETFNVEQEMFGDSRRRNLISRVKIFAKQRHFVELWEDVEYHRSHEGVIYSSKRWKNTLEEKITYPGGIPDVEILKDEDEEEEVPIDLSPIEFPSALSGFRRKYQSANDTENFIEDEILMEQTDTFIMEDFPDPITGWITSPDQTEAYTYHLLITYDYSDPDHLDTCSPKDFRHHLG